MNTAPLSGKQLPCTALILNFWDILLVRVVVSLVESEICIVEQIEVRFQPSVETKKGSASVPGGKRHRVRDSGGG